MKECTYSTDGRGIIRHTTCTITPHQRETKQENGASALALCSLESVLCFTTRNTSHLYANRDIKRNRITHSHFTDTSIKHELQPAYMGISMCSVMRENQSHSPFNLHVGYSIIQDVRAPVKHRFSVFASRFVKSHTQIDVPATHRRATSSCRLRRPRCATRGFQKGSKNGMPCITMDPYNHTHLINQYCAQSMSNTTHGISRHAHWEREDVSGTCAHLSDQVPVLAFTYTNTIAENAAYSSKIE